MWRAFEWIACRLSPRHAARFGAALGFLGGRVLGWRRAVARENLRQAFPRLEAAQLRPLLRAVYAHLGAVVVSSLRLPLLTPAAAEALLGDEVLVELRRLLAARRGLIVLSAHLGFWDLLACAAARAGLPVNVVTRQLSAGALNRWWMDRRAASGVRLWPARGSALALAQCLRRGELVAMVLDQHQPGGAVVPFFGRPAATARGLAQLARLSGAPVLPAFMVQREGGPGVELGPVLRFDGAPASAERGDSGSRCQPTRLELRQAEDRFTAVLTALIEQQVRRFPEQWFWVHRRWKVPSAPPPRPKGRPGA